MAGTAARGLRIGLTGGLGSGKSRAAAILEGFGALRLDADALARELSGPGGAALPALVDAFGPGCLDAQGGLDRAAMRARMLAEPAVKARLEAILHPAIGAAFEARSAAAGLRPQVFEVPLLVEQLARWRPRVDRILVIEAPRARQIARVQARNGWPRGQIEAMLDAQATPEARRAAADAVVANAEDDPQALQAALATLWARWTTPTL